jgi:hypothetical protein
MSDKIYSQTSICALHIPATATLSSCMQGACRIGCRSAQMSDRVIIEEPTVASVCATCQIDCLAAIRPFILQLLGYISIHPVYKIRPHRPSLGSTVLRFWILSKCTPVMAVAQLPHYSSVTADLGIYLILRP